MILTGGSSGIGLGLLEGFLARFPEARAINLSRSEPPLAAKGRLVHLASDLSSRSGRDEALARLREEILPAARGPVLLVHNSGIGFHAPQSRADRADQLATIEVNAAAPVHLTVALLPELRALGGVVATVCSTSAFQPTPVMATYGATKSFLLHWTLALGEELRGTNLRTLALCPGGTHTPFLPKAGLGGEVRSYWRLQEVDEVADAFFRGLARRRSLVVPGFVNRTVAAFAQLAPLRWSAPVAGHLLRRARPRDA